MQRYHLERSGLETDKTIIVDFGGPGIAALAEEDRLGTLRSVFPQFDAFNLLLVEEPWVTAPIDDSCREALTAFYNAVRASLGIGSSGAAIHSKCDLGSGTWGFTPATYREAVEAITRKEDLELDGFIGHSWGGVRLAYLRNVEVSFVALIRPYPLGVPLDRLLDARVEKATERDAVPTLELPVTVATRSVPISAFDLASAKVALGYIDDANLPEYEMLLATHGPEIIGQLSDSLWGRYGVDSVAVGFLGELEEICSTTAAPADLSYPSTDTVRGVLASRLAPCAGMNHGERSALTPIRIVTESMCIVTSDGDSITPDHLIQQYYPASPSTRWVKVDAQSHSSFDGLAECVSS